MRIAVLAHGSRGDVQPPLALAHRLAQDGHEVTVALPSDFAQLGPKLGLRTVTIPLDARAFTTEPTLVEPLRRGKTVGFFRLAIELDAPRRPATLAAVIEAMQGAELVFVAPLLEDIGVCVAEAQGQRLAFMHSLPLWPNATYPSMLFAGLRLPRPLNAVTHWVTDHGARSFLPMINEARATLGLGAVRSRPLVRFRDARPPVFYWVPAEVLPKPAAFGANHHMTGYWGVPPAVRAALGEQRPPEGLAEFLAAGPPPLFVGLGSMPVVDEGVAAIFARAAARLGLRVVLGRGWSPAPHQRDAQVFTIDAADHDWLLPRCAAAVHHGGASTTGAAIRAGIPAVVTPVFADQPMWARRVEAIGVGVALPFQKLDEERLVRALGRALDEETKGSARALAERLAATPDGLDVVADIVAREGAGFPSPRA